MRHTTMMRVLLFAAVACSAARAEIIYTFSDSQGVGFQYTAPGYLTSPTDVAITVPAASLDLSTPAFTGYTISDVLFYPGGGGPDNYSNNVEILIDEYLPNTSQTAAIEYFFAPGTLSADGDYYKLGEIGNADLLVTDPPSAVPEPTSLILLLTTLIAVALVARKRIAHAALSDR